MITVSIDSQLKNTAPNLTLGVVFAKIQVIKKSPLLWEEINKRIEELQSSITLESIMISRK